jgi:hypothetical protein
MQLDAITEKPKSHRGMTKFRSSLTVLPIRLQKAIYKVVFRRPGPAPIPFSRVPFFVTPKRNGEARCCSGPHRDARECTPDRTEPQLLPSSAGWAGGLHHPGHTKSPCHCSVEPALVATEQWDQPFTSERPA